MIRPATIGRRVGAVVIDGAVATAVLIVAVVVFGGISVATGGGFPPIVAGVVADVILAAWLLVQTWMQGGAGSFGMRALRLRLLRWEDGAATDRPLGFGRALLRAIVWGLGGAVVIGYFSPLFDPSPWRRGWHDKVAGAVMADAPTRATQAQDAGASATAPPPVASPVVAGPFAAASPATAFPVPAVPVPSAVAPVPSAALPHVPAPAAAPAGRAPALPTPAVPTPAVPARGAAPGGLISFVPGVTSPERANAAAAPPMIPQTAVGGGLGGRMGGGFGGFDDPIDETVIRNDDTVIVGGEKTPSGGDRALARLVWDDGSQQGLYGRTVFGRNPAPERDALVTPVRDETLSLSKTHFELAPDADRSLWVVDRHSTNGVVVLRGTQRQTVPPGERVRVHPGDVLEFGDRHVRIEVAP